MQVDDKVEPQPLPLVPRAAHGPGLMLAVVATTVYLVLVVGISLAAWSRLQGLSSGPDAAGAGSSDQEDLGMVAAFAAIYLFLAALGLVGVAMTRGRWIRVRFGGGHRPSGRTCRWAGLWPAMALLPALGTFGALGWYCLRQATPGLGGPDAVDSLTGLTGSWSVTAVLTALVIGVSASISEEVLALAIPIWVAGKLARWVGGQSTCGGWVCGWSVRCWWVCGWHTTPIRAGWR